MSTLMPQRVAMIRPKFTSSPADGVLMIDDPDGKAMFRMETKSQFLQGVTVTQTPYTTLAGNVSGGATSITVSEVLVAGIGLWLVIDPYTIECEVRRITAVDGSTLTLASATSYSHVTGDKVIIAESPVLNARWFGAEADGSTDDRVALNRAVAQVPTGGVLYCPVGTYRVRPAGSNPQMINLSGRTDITICGDGAGTVFEHDPTYPWDSSQPDAHMFLCVGSKRITFRDIKFDGQWDLIQVVNPSLNEQVHGIYLSASTVYGQTGAMCEDITVDNVYFYNIRGDGIYMIGDATYQVDTVRVLNCKFEDNGRSGAAHQSVVNLWYDNCDFVNISDQDLDFEITSARPFSNIFINNCRFNHSTATLSVALTGYDDTNRMNHVRFTNNVMTAAAFNMRYVHDAVVANNTVIGPDNNRPMDFAAGCSNLFVIGNYVEDNYGNEGAIRLNVGTTPTSQNVHIMHNIVVQNETTGAGIYAFGVDRGLVIHGNMVAGAGEGQGIDFGVEAAIGTVYDYVAEENDVWNFATGLRLRCGNNATNELDTVSICHNRFVDTQESPTQITGIWLDSNNNANFIANQSLIVESNVFGRGITTPINNQAAVTPICIGGVGAANGGAVAVGQWLCVGTPEGVVTARIGSTAVRSDGGASTTLYVKESGTGNTGWRAV